MEPPPELELQRRWATAPPDRLRDDAGREWRVLFAGTWNHGPGPDFRDALLLPAWGPALRGDVEIHRRPDGWRAHGHDVDPAYGRVLFQLCGQLDGEEPPGAGAGRSPPRARAPRPGPRRNARLEAGGLPGPAPPCAHVVQRAGEAAVLAALSRLARERLLTKAGRLREAAADDPDSAAYAALLAALGAGGDGVARVPERLPWAEVRDAVGSGSGEGASAALAARLRAALPAAARGARGRPANAPARRLAAAAVLLPRLNAAGGGSLARGLIGLTRLPEREALAALRVPRLLGDERARQLLVDAAYPFALARAPREELAVAWERLGGARYGRTEALRGRLREGGLRRWRNGATQALLSLERCYCRSGACAVCPLARLAGLRPGRAPLPSPNAGPLPPPGEGG